MGEIESGHCRDRRVLIATALKALCIYGIGCWGEAPPIVMR